MPAAQRSSTSAAQQSGVGKRPQPWMPSSSSGKMASSTVTCVTPSWRLWTRLEGKAGSMGLVEQLLRSFRYQWALRQASQTLGYCNTLIVAWDVHNACSWLHAYDHAEGMATSAGMSQEPCMMHRRHVCHTYTAFIQGAPHLALCTTCPETYVHATVLGT